jgi:MoaA/NifB/PqqE/SkfB family radical SAM enzyme
VSGLMARKEANSRLLREDVARRATIFRGMPELIALHTTEICNLRCVMCPRSLGQGKLQLSRERLAAACDALFPTAKKVALSAAAGEPLLADFDLVLAKALEHEVKVDVVTNGTELTPERYLAAASVLDHVNVSVDSHLKDVYERIRVGGRFDRLERNLRGIADQRRSRPDGVLLSISAVVMRSTLSHLPGLVRFARELGVDGLILQRLSHSVPAARDEDPFLLPDGAAAVTAMLGEVKAVAREVGQNVFVSDFGEPNLIVAPPREKVPPQILGKDLCWYLIQHFGVQPTGEVYPCCYPTDHRLGDLETEEPEAIWNGEPAQRLRAAHYAGRGSIFCAGCIQAPHLKSRLPRFLLEWLRARRMKAARLAGARRASRVAERPQ